ncbi:sulfate ABC transporter permease subunit CysW [Aminipila butyrica]|uniref:Sulfate ABC transporter permease subunit CysW n=1 Tax=Aminipila butyrica TaxID=433296 RepID=A0A858BX05_9FIRM|nr:sulfate ABC transporter permease subunit CysW [Aminipila butyrica]QIB70473.1 sulfate ABC transporter permease subunit CysW [Aminipila butyrica]
MKSKIVQIVLIGLGIAFLVVMLILPLITVLVYALRQGWETFGAAITDDYAVKAMELTLFATSITVVINTVFGLFAAWAITKFRFRGKQALTTLIDIPFSISPIIAGLVFILVFGRIGWANPLVEALGAKIVFAVPGIVLATIFVTFPFVSRELIPLMQAQGSDEEEAAALMGANGFRIFRKITFPHIKWSLLYGVILCTARALGEFGAVSVVSGHLRGKTNTLPLHVEILFNEFNLTAAFAVSSILVVFAVIILILRFIVERRVKSKEG